MPPIHLPATFEDRAIRRVYDEAAKTWWFSVVDIISVLTDSPNPAVYWRVLKKRLKDEGNETVTNCNGLKMMAADGKQRLTDVGWRESQNNSAWMKGINEDEEQACFCSIPFIPFIQAKQASPMYSVRENWGQKVALIFQSPEAKPIQKAVS